MMKNSLQSWFTESDVNELAISIFNVIILDKKEITIVRISVLKKFHITTLTDAFLCPRCMTIFIHLCMSLCPDKISTSISQTKYFNLTCLLYFWQRLYRFGARKFFVNNIPPAGCFPSSAVHMRPRGSCNTTLNRMITFYNKRLPGVLYQLQSQHPGFIFVHSDLYGFLLEMRTSAHEYGR